MNVVLRPGVEDHGLRLQVQDHLSDLAVLDDVLQLALDCIVVRIYLSRVLSLHGQTPGRPAPAGRHG